MNKIKLKEGIYFSYKPVWYNWYRFIMYKIYAELIHPCKELSWKLSNKHWVASDLKPHYFCYKKHLFTLTKDV